MADGQFATHAELFDLSGKHALVTGGTRGIGMMIARGLLQAGARVVISSRKADACAQAQEQLSEFGDVQAIPADLSQHDECERLADLVTADSGSLDILVNNAGAMWDEPLATFPDAAWDTVIDLNLKSPFWLVQALLPALRRAGTADDPARIINIGSIAAIHIPQPAQLLVLQQQGRAASTHQSARQGTWPAAHHGERGGAGTVPVDDDGGHPRRVRRGDRGVGPAAPDRPRRRHGGCRRVPRQPGRRPT